MALALLLAAGCAAPDARDRSTRAQPADLYGAASRPTAVPETLIERPEYRLAVGDTVVVGFHPRLRAATQREVRLAPGDRLSIRFPFDAKYDQQPAIQPDGKVRVLLLGPVRAAGLSLDELSEQLRVGYARYIREPELTVDLEAADAHAAAARAVLAAAEARRTPIKPDGTIDLPYVGEAPAAGRTVRALRSELTRLCAEAGLDELEVSVRVEAFAPRRLYVVGEVAMPGRIEAESATTLVQALASAGGITPRGDDRHVLLVRRAGLPLPEATVVDVQCLWTAARARAEAERGASIFRFDPWLVDGDIIYVPTKELARAGGWIDQVFARRLRAVLPCEARFGLDAGYQLKAVPVRAVARTRP